jgi:hypothetical protein
MKPIKDMNVGELSAYVCTFLLNNGVKCILTGGACVSIYTNNKYLSFDLDFIEEPVSNRKIIKALLSQIGFSEKERYFVNEETKFIIEFPSGPLSVGSEPIRTHNELQFDTGKLFLLTPTDCVKDRLAAFYFWDDNQALEQAIWVTENHEVDLNEIRSWSETQGQLAEYDLVKKRFFTLDKH